MSRNLEAERERFSHELSQRLLDLYDGSPSMAIAALLGHAVGIARAQGISVEELVSFLRKGERMVEQEIAKRKLD
jgi:hypothetical protein